jgi:hypothetical protein
MQKQCNRLHKRKSSGLSAFSILTLGLIAIALVFSFAALYPKQASVMLIFALVILFFIASSLESIDTH